VPRERWTDTAIDELAQQLRAVAPVVGIAAQNAGKVEALEDRVEAIEEARAKEAKDAIDRELEHARGKRQMAGYYLAFAGVLLTALIGAAVTIITQGG
jgi:ABC-type enterochelin transport system substrate-binding protein